MNNLNTRQRKVAYVVGILVLMVPVVLLGMPGSGRNEDSGGVLARLRSEHDLGESDLGQIDPTSVTMNLMLLGLRGVAVNLLRMDLDHYKDTKDWARMESTTRAVITLQPHYVEVWRFLSWNLSYNVSAEWDSVPDRYYWVKKGGKFSQEGTLRNRQIPELYWETGKTWSQKIGRSDEWKYFRKYFVEDPNTELFKNGPDPEINPEGKDNYLVSREWFVDANDAEDSQDQHIMMRALFRSYPSKSLMDYADARQREGVFDSATVQAWANGFTVWTGDYGKMRFQAPEAIVQLEANEDDVRQLAAEQNIDPTFVSKWVERYQNTVNYRYWRTRALSESEQETGEAHRLIYEGEQTLFKVGPEEAAPLLKRGMELFEDLLRRHPELISEDLTIEEGMWAVLLWQKCLLLEQQPIPRNFPLQQLWDTHQEGYRAELESRYNRGGL